MSSGFVTESEALEVRRKKQEEWERVRKADDPLERPEETYDHRSLFERLQEQKQKRDLEYEEAHKLKNMIKGLDDDEIEFLDLVDRTKLAADRKKTIEEELELKDYRNRVASLQEKNLDQKLQSEISMMKPKSTLNNRTSQTKLLKGVVVKKTENKKRKHSEVETEQVPSDKDDTKDENGFANRGDGNNSTTTKKKSGKQINPTRKGDNGNTSSKNAKTSNVGLTCIGILPGLGCYDDSSSEASSDSDQDEVIEDKPQKKVQIDLLGRKLLKKLS